MVAMRRFLLRSRILHEAQLTAWLFASLASWRFKSTRPVRQVLPNALDAITDGGPGESGKGVGHGLGRIAQRRGVERSPNPGLKTVDKGGELRLDRGVYS